MPANPPPPPGRTLLLRLQPGLQLRELEHQDGELLVAHHPVAQHVEAVDDALDLFGVVQPELGDLAAVGLQLPGTQAEGQAAGRGGGGPRG